MQLHGLGHIAVWQVLLKLGPGSWSPGTLRKRQPAVEGTWKQELAGPGFVVWSKG